MGEGGGGGAKWPSNACSSLGNLIKIQHLTPNYFLSGNVICFQVYHIHSSALHVSKQHEA